jgi:ankyrin repeat protein
MANHIRAYLFFNEAIVHGDIRLLKDALNMSEGYIDINKKSRTGNAPLHIACRNGNFECISFLLEKGADPNSVNMHNETPIFYLNRASPDFEKIVIILTENGANINHQDENGDTVLHKEAVYISHFDITYSYLIHILIKYGADYSIKNNKGKDGLSQFSEEEKKELEKFCTFGIKDPGFE